MPPDTSGAHRQRTMFLYWGRRGALARMALDLASAASAHPELRASFCVSRQSETFAPLSRLGVPLLAIDTFESYAGVALGAWRIPALRRELARYIARERIGAIVELIPHVWSPLVLPAMRRSGVRYATIVHEADPHPGDYRTAWAMRLMLGAAGSADRVLTLSRSIAGRLAETGRIPRERITTLFHPDLVYGPLPARTPPDGGRPLRLLFLGRILPYKGLPLLLEAMDRVKAEGGNVALGIFGEGSLAEHEARIAALGAEVVNRWLGEDEIPGILARYDAVVLSHTSASQSGVAAAAFGAGMPVVTTPVGGLAEQVEADGYGIVAARPDAEALSSAILRLAREPGLYGALCRNLRARAGERSAARFIAACSDAALA